MVLSQITAGAGGQPGQPPPCPGGMRAISGYPHQGLERLRSALRLHVRHKDPRAVELVPQLRELRRAKRGELQRLTQALQERPGVLPKGLQLGVESIRPERCGRSGFVRLGGSAEER